MYTNRLLPWLRISMVLPKALPLKMKLPEQEDGLAPVASGTEAVAVGGYETAGRA
ncbi:hypothetical protein RSKD131_4488 (plasmid) [Cereibacter sphaeroides KD131]|nr:hypothetical protein RSKD131_4488 [Cereibacter sphaeroides KD131]